MSSIGKIFIVLNLILAAAFFGWAANAVNSNAEFRQKFMSEETAHRATRSQLEDELKKANADKADLTKRNNDLIAARDGLSNDVKRFEADLKNELDRNAQMRANLDTIAATLKDIEESKNRLQQERDAAQTAQRAAEDSKREALDAQAAADSKTNGLMAELATANESIARLEKEKTSINQELSGSQAQLATVLDMTKIDPGQIKAMPLIQGAVLDVSTEVQPGLVAINRGSADGVTRGFTFEIFDGQSYKDQARVEFVHPNMSSAVIVRTVPGQTIRQGDGAATRL